MYMATASFEKSFVVKDSDSIAQIKKDLTNPIKVVVKQRDYEVDKKKGHTLLAQQLSVLGT